MKFFTIVVFVTVLTVSTAAYGWPADVSARAVCSVSIQKDFGSPQPLLLLPNKTGYYLPSNQYGDIHFQSVDTINLSCPQGQVIINGRNTGKSLLPIRCKAQKVFEVVGTQESANLNRFTCTRTNHTARKTGKTCLGGLTEIEVGFQVEAAIFLQQMTICFDSTNQTTAYSGYNLTKTINGYQYNVPRPQFIEGHFYNLGKQKLYNLYSVYVQRINVNRQLGLPYNSKKYIANGYYYLSRGHLTARADFVYGTQQNATFYYVNAAPQWQTFNEGNWNELEKSVRKYAVDNLLDLVVYTGTYGVATLPHETTNKETALYLYNENGKRGIPVPRIYWKIVYNARRRQGIAFVGLNNPYNKAVSEDILCKDICNQLNSWKMSWDRTNITAGYSYCCSVNELKKRIKNIPNLIVNGILL